MNLPPLPPNFVVEPKPPGFQIPTFATGSVPAEPAYPTQPKVADLPQEFTTPCMATIIPSMGPIIDLFKQLAQLPKEALDAATGEFISIRDKILSGLQDILEAIGYPFSCPFPLFSKNNNPEIEWEQRAKAMVQEFTLFIISIFVKLINSIVDLIPLEITLQICGMSFTIDLTKIFDGEYIRDFKAQLAEIFPKKFNEFLEEAKQQGIAAYNAAKESISGFMTWCGEFGNSNSEFSIQELWQNMLNFCIIKLYELIYNALKELIDIFENIWDALNLPNIVDFLTCDIGKLINDAIEGAKAQYNALLDQAKQAYEDAKTQGEAALLAAKEALENVYNQIYNGIVSALEQLEIFGFKLIDILSMDSSDKHVSFERTIARLKSAAIDFVAKFPLYLLQIWMKIIKAFLDAIGLGDILQWLTFTFCDFLTMLGIPESFPVPQVSSGDGRGLVTNMAPSIPQMSPVPSVPSNFNKLPSVPKLPTV